METINSIIVKYIHKILRPSTLVRVLPMIIKCILIILICVFIAYVKNFNAL